jgi:hypothetical protein
LTEKLITKIRNKKKRIEVEKLLNNKIILKFWKTNMNFKGKEIKDKTKKISMIILAVVYIWLFIVKMSINNKAKQNKKVQQSKSKLWLYFLESAVVYI